MSMLEAAAEALYNIQNTDEFGNKFLDHTWEQFASISKIQADAIRAQAHAVISAIRVPSEAVLQDMRRKLISTEKSGVERVADAFSTGIDAILADKTGERE